jgi:hypothetical protein
VEYPDLTKVAKYLFKQEFKINQSISIWHPDGSFSNFRESPIATTSKPCAIVVEPLYLGNGVAIMFPPAQVHLQPNESLDIIQHHNKEMQEFCNSLNDLFGLKSNLYFNIQIWGRYKINPKAQTIYPDSI